MGPEFGDYFQSAFEGIRFPSGDAESVARAAIADAEEQLRTERGVEFRSDARYVLLLNLAGMYVDPVLNVQGTSWAELQQDVLHDAYIIALSAADEANLGFDGGAVSGRAVISAVSRVWGDLRAGSMLWEP
jgi:hypothetical protein